MSDNGTTRKRRRGQGVVNEAAGSRSASSRSARNNVGSLRIQRPPIRNEYNDNLVRWAHMSKKYRTEMGSQISLEDAVKTMELMRGVQATLINKLMEKATTPGRFNPEDTRLLRQINEEYAAYMDLFLRHARRG